MCCVCVCQCADKYNMQICLENAFTITKWWTVSNLVTPELLDQGHVSVSKMRELLKCVK
jgi:hypothetical protein